MKKLENSNKIAIFLSKIPDILYIIGFMLGNIITAIIKILSQISTNSKISKDLWLIIAGVIEFLIEAGVISELIVVLLGVCWALLKRRK